MKNTFLAYFSPIFIVSYILLFLISSPLKKFFGSLTSKSDQTLHIFVSIFDFIGYGLALLSLIIFPLFFILSIILGISMIKKGEKKLAIANIITATGLLILILFFIFSGMSFA